MNFSARVEHLMGASSQLQAEYSRRQNDRDNLGVGDFDLPERAYSTDNSTDTFRAALDQRDRQESVQRVSLLVDRLDLVDDVAVDGADDSRQRRVQCAAARGRWASVTPARSSWRRTSTSASAASIRCAPACCSKPAGGTAISDRTRSGPTRSPASMRSSRTAGDLFDPRRRSARRLFADEGGLVPAG